MNIPELSPLPIFSLLLNSLLFFRPLTIYCFVASLQVSELTADLAEEHSTSTLATERLEAETAQRMKLDKEFSDLEVNYKMNSILRVKIINFCFYFRPNSVK